MQTNVEKVEKVDYAVVGLGAMGSAALYQLSKRGASVIGIDRYAPPHTLGSTHGETRITRQAVGEGINYVPLVLRSQQIWRELEDATGERLFNACGVLIISPKDNKALHHGMMDFVLRSIDSAKAFGIEHEVLDYPAIAQRFPQLTGLAGNEHAYWEAGGGYVMPEACIEAQLKCAREFGAQIMTDTEVLAIEQTDAGVRLSTSQGTIIAGQVAVAAGGWSVPLLGAPFDHLLKVSRQLLHWYALEDASAYGPDAPVFIWMHGEKETDYFYGFPPEPGDLRIKVATEQYDTTTTPEQMDRTVAPEESAQMYQSHIQGRLAGVTPTVAKSAACLYTVTPDRGFIIDRHPAMNRVMVISACSGHGFKHSAGIGEAVAQQMMEQHSDINLAPFSLSRFSSTD